MIGVILFVFLLALGADAFGTPVYVPPTDAPTMAGGITIVKVSSKKAG